MRRVVPVGAEATACREAVRRASHAINSCPPLRGEASADAGLRLLQSCWQENESPALRWCAYLVFNGRLWRPPRGGSG